MCCWELIPCKLKEINNKGAGASSASPNPRDFPEVLHAELYRGNNSQTSAGALHWSSSSNTLVPLRHGNEAPQELSSDSAQHALTKDDDTPKILSSSPNGPMQACSSNQKCVSPPQIQLKDTSLRPSPSLTNEQTIIRLGTPSVRPFSWCSNSKDGIPQVKSHPNDSTSNQWLLAWSEVISDNTNFGLMLQLIRSLHASSPNCTRYSMLESAFWGTWVC